MALYSYQVEKHFLGGLTQNPEVFTEIESFVTEKTFHHELHGIIFSCFRSAFNSNEKIDSILLAQKIQNLGIKTKDNIDIFEYVKAISFTQITPKATIEAAAELSKMAAAREIEKRLDKMKEYLHKNINQPFESIVTDIDKQYSETVSSFEREEGWKLLGDGLLEMVEERGNNPIEEVGLASPFPEFNRLYGGYRPKNLYIYAARAKAGKSTLLNDIATKMSVMHNMPVLYLDTEMSTEETQWRNAASKSGVPMWYLETGKWRKNPEWVEKVRKQLPTFIGKSRVYHYHVGNKSIDEIKSICRRWFLKVCGRGNKGLIIFDYVKIVEATDGNTKEYQLMGLKFDMLKKLAEELNIPILTACQNNRQGIVTNRDASEIIDDESSVGISDRITWYATYVGLFRRRTADEYILDTPESGTHKLVELVSRFQGKDAPGHQDLIKRTFPDGKTKYVKNFINFNIDNFQVEERGSLKDCIRRQNMQCNIQDKPEKEGGIKVKVSDPETL